MSRQQSSESQTKESSNIEGSSSSSSKTVVTNARDTTDKAVNSETFSVSSESVPKILISTTFRRRTLVPKVSTTYGENKETSQQSSQSVAEESSKVEKITSNSQSVATNREGAIDADVNSEDSDVTLGQVSTFRRPSLLRRPSVGLIGDTAYVQREETASQQSSDSSKTESLKVEETKSKSQSIAFNREGVIDANVISEDSDASSDVTLGQVSISRRPSLPRRPSVGLIGDTSYVQREETASQQSSNSSKIESLKVEETKSKSQSIAFNREGVIDANVNSEDSDASSDVTLGQVSIFRRPSLPRRPSVGLRGDTAYVDRKEISSQESSVLSRTESSKVAESTSSISQTGTASRQDLSEKDLKSRDLDTNLKPLVEAQRPVLSGIPSLGMRGDIVYGELKKTSSQQKSESLNDVSSKEEKIESSNVKSVSTNTENLTNDRSNLELKGGTIIKQSDTKTVSKTKLNSKSESSSSMERENFAKKSSDTSTTSTESNLINVITGKPVIMITDNPISWETAGQAYYPVLINAGFLKDRPVSTGLVGLDPLSGVTHSDLRDSEVAAELLPLSCGNVIFGERNTGGKMLLCDLPRPGDKPYQFLRGDTSTISSEKLNGPDLPGVILPGTGLNAKDDEIPYNPMFLDAEKSINQKPARRRIILKRPNAAHREFNVNEDIREVGSKQAAMESVSTSSSTVKKASSLEESTFSPSFGKEITKSKFDVSSAEDFNAEGAKGALNSKFYSLSQESIRPHPVTRDSSTAGEKEPTAIVEVVDSAPSTETKINLKRLRVSSSDDKLPRNDLEVLNIKTSEDNAANVEEERFVRPAETTRRRRLKFNRLPGRVQRAVISPDDISMSGRINVVGPIPAGYIDPALIREDEIGIELPRQHVTSSFQLLNIERQQEARDRGCTAFKPSPVDPINWPK
ncbi:serine-rich adhesin for platelets-like [Neodiprion lecontei]|uniref:Serine-rich adhesin for platelets-like n=1 Tax=Neodiprion lecontei TaxID=441921 RepID=A0ABM3G9P7_NEOLC|nr:serine-rich adhesin for platelets-like [Neodiprion lecontei]